VLRDLGDVQDHLAYRQPETPRVLIGQGLGALYALAFACERPDGIAALVLAAPLLEPRFDVPSPPAGILKAFKKVRPTTPGRVGWDAADLTSDEGERRARAADPLVRDVITVRAAETAADVARLHRGRFGDLSMPTLVLQGTGDRIAPPEFVRSLSGSSLTVRMFDGLRHDLLHESGSAAVLAEVSSWLDARLPR
jgi:lysophospholipase